MAAVVPLRPWTPPEQLDLFPLLSPAKWQGSSPPQREWMVQDLFAKRTVGLVAGDGKVGKSTIMHQLCACAALGVPWLGLPTRRVKAVYFACEDDEDELQRRTRDICRHYDCEEADLADAGLHIAVRLNERNRLCMIDRSNWEIVETPLLRRCLERCLELGIQLFVIDTQAQVFGGQLMNFLHAVEFVAILRRFATAIDGLVILVTHPSDNGRRMKTGEAGSTQWVNASRSHAYMHKDKDSGLVLEHMRGNYSRAGLKIPLEWRQGVFVRRNILAPPRWND